jgi:hypothetical protein
MAQLPELQFAQPMTAYAQGRNQKLAEQLKGLEMKKAEKQMANLDQVSTLNEFKIKQAKTDALEEAFGTASKGLDFINQQEQAAMQSGKMTAEEIAQAKKGMLGDLVNHIGSTYGMEVGQQLTQNPELIAKMYGEKTMGQDAKSQHFDYMASDLNEEEIKKAKRINLGLAPRQGTKSKEERLVEEPDVAEKIIGYESKKAGAVEESKLRKKFELEPMLKAANAQAAVEGKDRGDDIVKLKFLDANMPNIESTVGILNELNKTATYTPAGLFVDSSFRTLGLPVPEGATTRAQAKSLIDTTILPLLKPTFGAAFTENEGNRLLATWGDQNASPEEKEMALQGMLTSVKLQAQTLRRKLGKSVPEEVKEGTVIGNDAGKELIFRNGQWEKY